MPTTTDGAPIINLCADCGQPLDHTATPVNGCACWCGRCRADGKRAIAEMRDGTFTDPPPFFAARQAWKQQRSKPSAR